MIMNSMNKINSDFYNKHKFKKQLQNKTYKVFEKKTSMITKKKNKV